jgi:hypothetical protein
MDYVENCYKKPSLEAFYAGILHPFPIDALPFDGLLPPVARAQAGRPKKVHMRNRSEIHQLFVCWKLPTRFGIES